MDGFRLVLDLAVAIGIPAIAGVLISIGRKLQVLDKISADCGAMKHNIKVISDSLINADNVAFDHTKLKTYSPLGLTEKGLQFLDEIGFIKIFNENCQDYFAFIDVEMPKTKYDVEISAIKSCMILFDKEYAVPLKKYLYDHPEENLRSLAQMTGVYVRDQYLKRSPDIQ